MRIKVLYEGFSEELDNKIYLSGAEYIHSDFNYDLGYFFVFEAASKSQARKFKRKVKNLFKGYGVEGKVIIDFCFELR